MTTPEAAAASAQEPASAPEPPAASEPHPETTGAKAPAGLPYYSRYVFGNAALTSVFMGAFLAPALIAGPIWMKISHRIGKQRGLLISQGIFIAGSAALLLGSVLGFAASVAIVVALGVAFAGLQLFAFSMVPDAVADAQTRGVSRAGSYTGVWTATEASGTAVGPYLYAGA
ncbi:MAG: MFS transporter, partial [Microbacteriaceae bacterium]